MTKTVKGAGRGRYAANKARHDQRTPFTDRPVHAEHTAALRAAAGIQPEHRLRDIAEFESYFRWYCGCGDTGGKRPTEESCRADFGRHAAGD